MSHTSPSARQFENLRDVGNGDTEHLRLKRCPACHADLDGLHPAAHINNEHSPSDFGLSPLRASEVPADD